MDGLFRKRADRVHDSLIRGEYPEEQDGEGRQDCEEVSQEYSGIAIQTLDHQENGGGDHENQRYSKQNKHNRDLKIQNVPPLPVDFVTLILFP